MSIKPRFTFKKKFFTVDPNNPADNEQKINGNEAVQIYDLSNNSDIKDTTESYYTYSQMEIIRDMKEEFLTVSDETLHPKVADTNRIG